MIKKFTKRQLMDQCGFTDEETKIILEYQKKLPILVDNDETEGFCINARDLWTQLGGPQGQFNKWVERKFKPYGFVKNVDFKPFGQNCPKPQGGRPENEYMLSIDMAKQLAMIDKKEVGFIARSYFILMEKAVKRNMEWELIRTPLKQGYNKLKETLDSYMQRVVQRPADDWDYKIEVNSLNILATGLSAQEIRNYVGCQDKNTRDSLTATYNEYLLKLQEYDILFLSWNLNRYERYQKLEEAFDLSFPDAKPLKDNMDIATIQANKMKLLEEVREKITPTV